MGSATATRTYLPSVVFIFRTWMKVPERMKMRHLLGSTFAASWTPDGVEEVVEGECPDTGQGLDTE